MKKILPLLFGLITIFSAYSIDFTIDGIIYSNMIDGGEYANDVLVIGLDENWSQSTLIIPTEVENDGHVYDVIGIGENACAEINILTNIIFPDDLLFISAKAFKGCQGLTVINLSTEMALIEQGAFQNCINLETVNNTSNLQELGSYAFSGCTSLRNFEIPAGITVLPAGVFNNTPSLKNISFPENLNSIGDSAFANSGLTGIIILPESLKTIGRGAFANDADITGIIIPENVQTIGTSAFSNCIALTGLDLSKFTGTFGNNAFENCSSITEIRFNPNLANLASALFSGCTSLKEIVFPDNLTKIDDYAFRGCTELEKLIIPFSIKSIGMRAFSGCKKLSQLEFQTENLIIEEGAFENNTSIENLYLRGISEVGPYSFVNSSSLEWIQIAPDVEQLDSYAFANCRLLKEIYLEPQWPPVITINTFDSTTENSAELIVAYGSQQRYELAAYWSRFNKVSETNNFPCNTENVGIDMPQITIKDSLLNIFTENPEDIKIYSLEGFPVADEINKTEYSVTLEKGIYIVRVGNQSAKILIK